MKRFMVIFAGVLFAVLGVAKVASAGPVIIDGTDANAHGPASGGVNQQGWKYMQDALEYLSRQVYTGTAKVVVDLGTTNPPCGQPTAQAAIDSAFDLSSLPGNRWTLLHEDSAISITDWLHNLSITNTGILYIPTYNADATLCGDLTSDEMDAINAQAAAIAGFVNGMGDPAKGGALFAMSENDVQALQSASDTPEADVRSVTPSSPVSTNAFRWLASITGFSATGGAVNGGDPGITLTIAGSAVFTDIHNGVLAAENWFVGDFGNLQVLGTLTDGNGHTQAAILGGPGTVPVPPRLDLTASGDVVGCVLPGSSYLVTWTVANVGDVVFPGGVVSTQVTGSGNGPLTTSIPSIPTSTHIAVTETVMVSEPVAYGGETVTVTGNILTATAVLATHICAPDFRTSAAHVTSVPVFAGAKFTYTWQISNTGDAAAPGVTAVLTLPTVVDFSFQDNLTFTIGMATYDPASNTVRWTGDIPVGGSVTVVFNAQADFGLPHELLAAPFEVDHPYRPPFDGVATYDYPYKLFFMLVLRDSSPTQAAPAAPGR